MKKKITSKKNSKRKISSKKKNSSLVKSKKIEKSPKMILKLVLQKIEIFQLNKNIGDTLSINFINEFRNLLLNLKKMDFQGRDLVLKFESLEKSEELLMEYKNFELTKNEKNEIFESILIKNEFENEKKMDLKKKQKNSLKNGKKKFLCKIKKKVKKKEIKKKDDKLYIRKNVIKKKDDENEKNKIFEKTKEFMYNSKIVKNDKKAGFEDIFSKFEKTIKKKKISKKNLDKETKNEIFQSFRNLNEDLKIFLKLKKKKIPKNIFFQEFLSLVDILFFNINKKNDNIFLKYDFILNIKKEFFEIKKKFEKKNFENLFLEIDKFSSLIEICTENFCYQSLIF